MTTALSLLQRCVATSGGWAARPRERPTPDAVRLGGRGGAVQDDPSPAVGTHSGLGWAAAAARHVARDGENTRGGHSTVPPRSASHWAAVGIADSTASRSSRTTRPGACGRSGSRARPGSRACRAPPASPGAIRRANALSWGEKSGLPVSRYSPRGPRPLGRGCGARRAAPGRSRRAASRRGTCVTAPAALRSRRATCPRRSLTAVPPAWSCSRPRRTPGPTTRRGSLADPLGSDWS